MSGERIDLVSEFLSGYGQFLCSKCHKPLAQHAWEKDSAGQWVLTKVNERCPFG